MADKGAIQERERKVAELEKYISERKKPATVVEMANRFKVQPNTIRQWLQDIGNAKLAVAKKPGQVKQGRPTLIYAIVGTPAAEAMKAKADESAPPADAPSED